MEKYFVAVVIIIFFFFPIWVAVHAWRKGYRKTAMLIGSSYIIPFIPQAIAFISFFFVKPYKPNIAYSPNPKSYVGCGTKFYGSSGRRGDGSFITTEWFSILYIPIIPIQSYRVVRGGDNTVFQGVVITSTTNYLVLETLRLDIMQVIKLYCFIISFIIILMVIIMAVDPAKIAIDAASDPASIMGAVLVGLLTIYIVAGYFIFRVK